MKHSILRGSLFVLTVFQVGCSIGPDYVKPELPIPTTFRSGGDPNASCAEEIVWWDHFEDPILSKLITQALENNNDLLQATATVDRFFALYGVQRSSYFPQIDGSATGYRQRSAEIEQFPGLGRTVNTYRSLLSLSWELDLWGRIRRLSEAARANLISSEAGRRGVILTLVSAVAQTYVELRELDRELELSHETLASRRESLKLARTRFEGGLTSELDVRQAEAEVATTEVTIPELERQVQLKQNQLSVLIGNNPIEIERGKAVHDLTVSTKVPAGLPSELLANRPDVVEAEQQLISSNALIGAAKAEFFPKISLTGLLGYSSLELNDLMESPSKTWRWGADVSIPLLNGGRVLNQVRASEAQQVESLYRYRGVVLNAFREAEDAIVGNQKAREQRDARERQVKVLSRYLDLARTAYEGGASGYLDVLDAQRNLFDAQIQLVRAQSGSVIAMIELYRALGGGWIKTADKLSTNPVDENPSIPIFVP